MDAICEWSGILEVRSLRFEKSLVDLLARSAFNEGWCKGRPKTFEVNERVYHWG